MPVPKSIKPIINELKKWVIIHGEARHVTNEANRAKSAVRKAFENAIVDGDISAEDKILYHGMEYTLGASVSKVIDPAKWLKLYEDGDISREQFIKTINVNKAKAELEAGTDQILPILIEVKGTTSDLRYVKAEKDTGEVGIIHPPKKVSPKKTSKTSGKRKVNLRRRA